MCFRNVTCPCNSEPLEPQNLFEPRHEITGFLHMRKKDADQLRSNCAVDQRLCFRNTASTILLLSKSKFQASSHLQWLHSLVCVGPGQKPRRPVFSQQGSYSKTGVHKGILFLISATNTNCVYSTEGASMRQL